MEVTLEKKAFKELKILEKNIKENIKSKLKSLEKYPNLDWLDIKKLKTPFEWYRLRVWNFRILYKVEIDFIKIYSIKHRKEAYKINY